MFDLSPKLDELSKQGLHRSRRIVESPQGINLICDGKPVINFCSNDYLGLANHPDVVNAFKSAANEFGVGSGSAHLVCGHSRIHHALEEELAEFAGRDRALLFSTGYMANLGAISALVGHGDTVLEDRLNHASLLDGGLLSSAKFKRYAHADYEHLNSLLASINHKKSINSEIDLGPKSARKLIVTDGVFSMDGDLAPIDGISRIAKQHDAWVMVDDAHGFGVLGKQGGGLLENSGLSQDDVQVLVGTLGKAFGTFGAFVAGSTDLIETLIQKARPYIYTTAMPAAIAAATRTSLKIVQTENWRRDKLNGLIAHFRLGAEQLGLSLMSSTTPIQPIVIGDAKKAVAISNALFDLGFLISAIRPPTVPKGTARLRITFSAQHEIDQIDHLLDVLAKLI